MSPGGNVVYDPDWNEQYQHMIVTPEQAVARLRPGNHVFIGTACAQPRTLVQALTERAGELADVEVIHLLTLGEAPYACRRLADCFTVNSYFIAENVRGHIQEGLGNYTPIMLSDIPRLFSSGQQPLDAALIQVTPPDDRGRVSLGVSVDIVKTAAENASLVIAEVNPHMPWTRGDTLLDVYDLDLLVPVNTPLQEVASPAPDEVTRQIGEHVAALVEDGATLEFGIGRIPHAVVDFLRDRQDLGVHSEMITDTIIGLVESGAVTGARKTLDRGKVVASFCMGSRRLYDYIDDNPAFVFRPTRYVNDPQIIGKQHRMTAINTALEVDLTGQVCADSLGTRFYSGIGGQVDFNRGAGRSPGGRAIIALPSTAREGNVSRIVARLTPGAGVVTTRGDVHYIVTEYGTAYLHGKSIQERAMALISIAHPDFREGLFRDAVEARYIREDLVRLGERLIMASPEIRTSMILEDGTRINFRSIQPTDEHAVKDLLYALSQETIFYRFMQRMQKFPHRQIEDMVYIDYRRDVAIVGTLPGPGGEEIVAVGRYYLDEKTNRAEVAFVVHDAWQNRGIGSFLLRHLATLARRNGIAGFTAEVLRDNRRMLGILNRSGCRIESELNDDVFSLRMDFDVLEGR